MARPLLRAGRGGAQPGGAGRGAAHRGDASRRARSRASSPPPPRRARVLAARIARRLGLPLEIEPRLAERDFGAWEGQAWDAIWQAEGSSMDGMIEAPDRFRPGGGETTGELAARAMAWLDALHAEGDVLAVAHGGPVAALVGTLRGEAPRAWLAHVPRVGEGVGAGAVRRWLDAGRRGATRRRGRCCGLTNP
jgi:broad specificity phosphatase PhoE